MGRCLLPLLLSTLAVVAAGCGEEPLTAPSEVRWRGVTAGGAHACALAEDGAAYCWGSNSHGQLGISSTRDRADEPLKVNGELHFVALSAGDRHTCGATAEGRAWCWGDNGLGQLGSPAGGRSLHPAPVLDLTSVVAVGAGLGHSCAVTGSGHAWCWGDNRRGQLGSGSTRSGVRPQRVAGTTVFGGVSAGDRHTCGLSVGGRILCWGANDRTQLGSATFADSSTPVSVPSRPVPFTSVSAGGAHTCALGRDGLGWCWGDNARGQIETFGADRFGVPVPVVAEVRLRALSAGSDGLTCAVTARTQWLCWGTLPGEDPTVPILLRPVEVTPGPAPPGAEGVPVALGTGGRHACVVRGVGGLACWGAGAWNGFELPRAGR